MCNQKNSSELKTDEETIRNNHLQLRRELPGLVADAAEIIIGNIPATVKPSYFLHLLDKFEPLAISYLFQVSGTEIYYCHAYFKSRKDAVKVIKKLNSLQLNENKLLVLFSTTLC